VVVIDAEFLDLLACPVCKTSLALTDGEDGLRCAGCGRVYPIEDDIPQLLPEKARDGGGGSGAP
jgi:LSD1 subclass zinc finger protein